LTEFSHHPGIRIDMATFPVIVYRILHETALYNLYLMKVRSTLMLGMKFAFDKPHDNRIAAFWNAAPTPHMLRSYKQIRSAMKPEGETSAADKSSAAKEGGVRFGSAEDDSSVPLEQVLASDAPMPMAIARTIDSEIYAVAPLPLLVAEKLLDGAELARVAAVRLSTREIGGRRGTFKQMNIPWYSPHPPDVPEYLKPIMSTKGVKFYQRPTEVEPFKSIGAHDDFIKSLDVLKEERRRSTAEKVKSILANAFMQAGDTKPGKPEAPASPPVVLKEPVFRTTKREPTLGERIMQRQGSLLRPLKRTRTEALGEKKPVKKKPFDVIEAVMYGGRRGSDAFEKPKLRRSSTSQAQAMKEEPKTLSEEELMKARRQWMEWARSR